MCDVLIGLGVDEDMILMDTTSASTHSNIKNAMQLLGGRNVTKVMIITSDYHLPRAIAIAEDNGLTAYGIGAPTKLGLRFWLKNHCREALACPALSQSVTVRDQIPRYVLQIETLGWRPFGSSQSVTSRAVLTGLVLQIEILLKPRMGAAAKT